MTEYGEEWAGDGRNTILTKEYENHLRIHDAANDLNNIVRGGRGTRVTETYSNETSNSTATVLDMYGRPFSVSDQTGGNKTNTDYN